MNVKRNARLDATLLLLDDRKKLYGRGEINHDTVTSYYLANWQSIPQSNAWKLLQTLVSRRLVSRNQDPTHPTRKLYALSKRGRLYVERHLLVCIAATTHVTKWKMDKYRRSLQDPSVLTW